MNTLNNRGASRFVGVALLVAMLPVAMLTACSDEDSPGDGAEVSNAADSGEGGADAGVGTDAAAAAFSPDDTDKAVFALLDKAHDALGKTPLWPGFALPTKPLYLIRRSLKGTARYAFVTHVDKAPAGAKTFTIGKHVVHRFDAKKGALSSTRTAYSYEDIAGVQATMAAYDDATPSEPAAFLGALAKASFERMKELDDTWEPVEGCGRSNYPRDQELLELTLLEDALFAETIAAKTADLPARMTEIVAIRARRLAIEPYTDRIDADGENRFGAPHFAKLTLPALVGVQSAEDRRKVIADSLAKAMTVPLEDLDDYLMWKRPLVSAVVLIDLARKVGVKVEPSFKAGKAAVAAIIAAKGAPVLSHIDTVKKRHDMAAITKRAVALMKY